MLAQDDYMPGLQEAVLAKRLAAAGLLPASRHPAGDLNSAESLL
jgi:hypothetical protein